MGRIRAALLAFFIYGCGAWSAGNLAMEGTYVASMAVDWDQTVGITRHCVEVNPIIGRCGQRVPPWVYFPLAVFLHVGVAGALRGEYRTAFQGTTLGIELATIFWNTRL